MRTLFCPVRYNSLIRYHGRTGHKNHIRHENPIWYAAGWREQQPLSWPICIACKCAHISCRQGMVTQAQLVKQYLARHETLDNCFRQCMQLWACDKNVTKWPVLSRGLMLLRLSSLHSSPRISTPPPSSLPPPPWNPRT